MDTNSRFREIERNQPKPKPYEPDRQVRVIIVDNFGEMRSGDYLKFLVKVLSLTTIVSILAGVLLIYFYTGSSREDGLTKKSLVLAEKKVNELTREKEMLMARLVMLGEDPAVEQLIERLVEKPDEKIKKPDQALPVTTIEEKFPDPPVPEKEDKINKSLLENQEKIKMSTLLKKDGDLPEIPIKKEDKSLIEKPIDLEKFSVTKDGETGDLLVRFDIRNISKEAGDVSGRIFIVLKPDNNFEDQFLVVPKSAIKDGIPSEYKKGQYFSIAHFKPVKFRIKHSGDSEFYKKASVFVFNEQADVIFEKLINITEDVESAQ